MLESGKNLPTEERRSLQLFVGTLGWTRPTHLPSFLPSPVVSHHGQAQLIYAGVVTFQ
jgi:hypothetical protein